METLCADDGQAGVGIAKHRNSVRLQLNHSFIRRRYNGSPLSRQDQHQLHPNGTRSTASSSDMIKRVMLGSVTVIGLSALIWSIHSGIIDPRLHITVSIADTANPGLTAVAALGHGDFLLKGLGNPP